jgi:glutathione S-transferase
MERKHRDTREDAHRAGARTADQPRALAAQVRAQYAQGRQYFIGDSLSALDIYWRSFGNLLDPLPKAQCPMPDDWRPMFVANVPQVTAALDLLLPAHRDQIFGAYFHSPMQF